MGLDKFTPKLEPRSLPNVVQRDVDIKEEPQALSHELIKKASISELFSKIDGKDTEELVCVIAVIRHGDRTPKVSFMALCFET